MTPKELINWLELEEILEGEHYTQQAVAGQEETEEKTAEEEHLEREEVCGEEEDTREGVGQAQKLGLLVVTGLEFSAIFRCDVVRGLYFWKNNSKILKHRRQVSLSFLSQNYLNKHQDTDRNCM